MHEHIIGIWVIIFTDFLVHIMFKRIHTLEHWFYDALAENAGFSSLVWRLVNLYFLQPTLLLYLGLKNTCNQFISVSNLPLRLFPLLSFILLMDCARLTEWCSFFSAPLVQAACTGLALDSLEQKLTATITESEGEKCLANLSLKKKKNILLK